MNQQLAKFMREAKRELYQTKSHSRRYIYLGYIKVNLDSLQKDGIICNSERQIANLELDLYCERMAGA